MNRKSIAAMMAIALISVTMTGCINGLIPHPSGYVWENPTDDSFFKREDVEENATEIKVSYILGTTLSADIDLNGMNVDDCFTFNADYANADLYCMREQLIEGWNKIEIDHSEFGPAVYFRVDTEGPDFAIRNVCFDDSVSCDIEVPSDGNVSVEVEYRELSGVNGATLNSVSSYYVNGLKYRFEVPVGVDYEFYAIDGLGYEKIHSYKRGGETVDEMVNVRVDELMLGELKDELAKGMSNLVASDAALAGLQGLNGPIGTKININYLETGAGTIDEIYITDEYGTDANLAVKMTFEPSGAYNDQDGNIEDFDNIGMKVDLVVDLPWWLLFGIDIPMSMFVERLEINSAVDLSIDGDSKVQLVLRQLDSGESVLSMFDVKSSDDGGSGIDIIGWLVGQPWLRGIILGVVQNVINANLEEIIVAASFFPTDGEPDTEIGVLFEPRDLEVSNYDADNIGNLDVSMKGTVTTVKGHPEVRPALGSYHVTDADGLPDIMDTGSSLAMSLNSNLVNQMLLAAYNTGVTHITLLDDKTYLGSSATDDIGVTGDIRVELQPQSAGQFFVGGDEVKGAWLEYNSAIMEISVKESDGTWKTLFLVDVDIKAGVDMEVVDSIFYMTMLGTPRFEINEITDLTFAGSWYSIFIDGTIVDNLVKVFIEWWVPFVVDSDLKIDISKAGLSDRLTTDGIYVESGHLQFEMGVNTE